MSPVNNLGECIKIGKVHNKINLGFEDNTMREKIQENQFFEQLKPRKMFRLSNAKLKNECI